MTKHNEIRADGGILDVLEDMSFEEGEAYNERLIPISRGDVLPDRKHLAILRPESCCSTSSDRFYTG